MWIGVVEISMDVLLKDIIENAVCCFRMCLYLCVDGALTNVQVTHAVGNNTPPYHDRL